MAQKGSAGEIERWLKPPQEQGNQPGAKEETGDSEVNGFVFGKVDHLRINLIILIDLASF